MTCVECGTVTIIAISDLPDPKRVAGPDMGLKLETRVKGRKTKMGIGVSMLGSYAQ